MHLYVFCHTIIEISCHFFGQDIKIQASFIPFGIHQPPTDLIFSAIVENINASARFCKYIKLCYNLKTCLVLFGLLCFMAPQPQ